MAVISSEMSGAQDARERRPWSQKRIYRVLAIAPLVFFVVFFAVPLVQVVTRSFAEPTLGLQNYVRILTSGAYVTVLLNTLQIAGFVTLICAVIGYPVAFVISRLQGVAFKIALGLVLIPLWTSIVIRSFAWMVLLQRNGPINDLLMWLGATETPTRLLQTPLAVGLGMVHVMLPYMILPLVSYMRTIDPVLIKAASILGAKPVRVFWRIYLPLTVPGLSAGILLVFVTSLGFYITPALLGGSRSTMIAVLINQEASEMLNWPVASALATVLLGVTLVLVTLHFRITRRFNEVHG